jgi:formimidoylglutamate deiminase
MNTLYRPELLYSNGGFVTDGELLVNETGQVLETSAGIEPSSTHVVNLPGKALLPGFVNAHSHSFQRLIRGKAESRIVSGKDFWSWRGTMYHAASQLDPQDVYDVARMAFLEMVLAGTTSVGEFHYLHNAPDGQPYDDPNLLSKQVIAAAQSVGIRIVLLRTAYLRSGYELPRDPGQIRFFEPASTFLENVSALTNFYAAASSGVRIGVAPHSIRAVPLSDLKEIAAWTREKRLSLHMHVAEQIAENNACLREYGLTPVEFLNRERILGPDFTAIHAVHINENEISMLADANATICSCPTTERNLGDGIIAADQVMRAGIPVALGSDSQAQIDPLEDARQLDYHLRLKYEERAILDQIASKRIASQLFDCGTVNGSRALGLSAGDLTPGSFADFFTVDLNDVSIAGHSAEDLLSILVFSLNRSAIRDVFANGRFILRDQKHPLQDEIISRYKTLHRKVWQNGRTVSNDQVLRVKRTGRRLGT